MSTTSTVVYHQGLKSCLDPFILEPPRVLTHQFSPKTPPLSTLPWPYKNPEIAPETEKNYVLMKHSSTSSSLSLKSLEMCTESLGSETGSGIDLNIDELSCHNHNDSNSVVEKQRRSGEVIEKAKAKKSGGADFPPPLSSIAGGDGVQVKTHREGGRLVIKAFSLPSSGNYFRAERENGRLRLSLLKDSYFESENEEEEQEQEQVSRDHEQEIYCEQSDDDDDDDYEGEEEGDSNGGFWRVGGGTGGGDRWSIGSRWCNGGGSGRKRLPSLPFCVAIS